MTLELQGYLLIYKNHKVTIYRNTSINDRLLVKNLATEYLLHKEPSVRDLMKQLKEIIKTDKQTEQFAKRIKL